MPLNQILRTLGMSMNERRIRPPGEQSLPSEILRPQAASSTLNKIQLRRKTRCYGMLISNASVHAQVEGSKVSKGSQLESGKNIVSTPLPPLFLRTTTMF